MTTVLQRLEEESLSQESLKMTTVLQRLEESLSRELLILEPESLILEDAGVLFIGRWWRTPRVVQVVDRITRIGQRCELHIRGYPGQGSIQEFLLLLQRKRRCKRQLAIENKRE